MGNEPKMPSISVSYRKDENYRIAPVSGAFGGPNPSGANIVVHFYFESQEPPEKIPLKPVEGRPGEFTEGSSTVPDFVRDLFFGAVLTPEQAVSIGTWLANHGKTILDSRKPPDA